MNEAVLLYLALLGPGVVRKGICGIFLSVQGRKRGEVVALKELKLNIQYLSKKEVFV